MQTLVINNVLFVSFLVSRTNITNDSKDFGNSGTENIFNLSYLCVYRVLRVTSDDKYTVNSVLEGGQPILILVVEGTNSNSVLTTLERCVSSAIKDSNL